MPPREGSGIPRADWSCLPARSLATLTGVAARRRSANRRQTAGDRQPRRPTVVAVARPEPDALCDRLGRVGADLVESDDGLRGDDGDSRAGRHAVGPRVERVPARALEPRAVPVTGQQAVRDSPRERTRHARAVAVDRVHLALPLGAAIGGEFIPDTHIDYYTHGADRTDRRRRPGRGTLGTPRVPRLWPERRPGRRHLSRVRRRRGRLHALTGPLLPTLRLSTAESPLCPTTTGSAGSSADSRVLRRVASVRPASDLPLSTNYLYCRPNVYL
ncbi:MAG: hypothetical protein A07HB70_02077 [uncultured archaeon A07HB70]|nr:MAG: hypothetical protein A07HB70_02077 [uncultured archaeon A07HB70]